MNQPICDVTFFADRLTAPFMIVGPNPERLRRLVESQLTCEERCGQPYDDGCMATNIAGVNEDVALGGIACPTLVEVYAAAIVPEFRANLEALSPDLRDRLFACFSQN